MTKRDRKIGKQIEDEMFVFADLINLSKKDIGSVARKVDAAILVPALRGASSELKEKIFGAMLDSGEISMSAGGADYV